MNTPTIRRLSTREPEFLSTLDALLAFDNSTDEAIEKTVAEILANVRTLGDAAVLDYTRRFDRLDAKAMIELELPRDELKAAFDGLPVAQRSALEAAAARVRSYHEQQLEAACRSWSYRDADGTLHDFAGIAPTERALSAMDAVDRHLYSRYGLHLVWPAFTTPDDDVDMEDFAVFLRCFAGSGVIEDPRCAEP